MRRESAMRHLSVLVWLTQLGLSVVVPLVGFVLLAVWLRNRFDLSAWVIWAGVVLGVWSAVGGLRSSFQTLNRLAKDNNEKEVPTAVSFNDHS